MFRHDGDTDWWWNGGEGDRSMYMWPQRNPVYYPPTNFDGRHERSVDRDDASPGTRGIGTDAVPEENYSYRIKIINPHKRSDFQIREIHNFKKKLESITELRVKLIEEFGELVPANTDFQVGYFLGKQAAKHWLANKDDLTLMYTSLGTKCELLLWCEARSEKAKDVTKSVKKRMSVDASDSRPPSKRQLIEEDVSETVAELKERHDSKFTMPQLRLWARMVASGNHDSLDEPPSIPALTGVAPKRRRESLSSVVAGVASTIASAIRPEHSPPPSTSTPGCSPGKVSDLRLKNLQQLRELQQLLEMNVLTPEEFAEQKSMVLGALRKLNS